MTIDAILDRVRELGHPMLLLTGGEPLLQAEAVELMIEAQHAGLEVVLETSGTTGARVSLAEVPTGVCRVVDIKTPGSGILATEVDWEGLAHLDARDEIKLVVIDRDDYTWSRTLLQEGLEVAGVRRRLPAGVPVTMSPGAETMQPSDLAAWILADRLPVRFQVQLHKVVWPEAEGGV